MTQVQMGDEVIETDLPEESVADLQTSKEPEKQPEADPQPEPKAEEQPEKTEEPAKPEAETEPAKERPKKAGPIADLLEKKHTLETELENERKARQDLESKIAELSKQPDNKQTDLDIKGLAEKYDLQEEFVEEMVGLARKGLNPQLPKEVQDLIAERNAEKQQQAELQAFDGRVQKLKGVFTNEPLDDPKVREKLLKLAYSTDKAPDGEPYYQKELSELYFAFIKPEIEPGKVSAESSHGGKAGGEVMDFEQIHGDDAKLEEFASNASSEQWAAYTKWRDSKQGDTQIIRRRN